MFFQRLGAPYEFLVCLMAALALTIIEPMLSLWCRFGGNGFQSNFRPGNSQSRPHQQQPFYPGAPGSNRQNFSQNHSKQNHNINNSQQQQNFNNCKFVNYTV
jgi:hypothetical protein